QASYILEPVSPPQVDDFGLPPGVRDEYLQGARDQLGTIAELAERLIASGDDTAAIEALRRDAHRLRGSAGSFGFPQASVVAAELEEAAKHWLEHPGNGVADRGQAARGYVRRLAAALFTKQSAAPPAPALPEPPLTLHQPPPPSTTSAPEGATDVPEVIVVEDDDTLAELLTFGLEARGYRYVLFRNGREALDQLKVMETRGAERPPLLLLDVDLPALDGYSVFEALTQDCPGKFRVVFTTVHGSETEQLRGLEAGAMDYMVKPMSLRVALEKIRRWVGR
ncbi:MAG TPA: response regulator, partial [Vicinamibacterales bacterium]|nr:response regulator [Vicinamibacterales bacterium]